MDDLISRQAILDMLEDINNHIIDGYGYKHDWCVEWVKGLPSIDAVPVIRCKDCKYASLNTVYGCVLGRFSVHDKNVRMYSEDYCSRAERKEE